MFKNQAMALYVMWGILFPGNKKIIKSLEYFIDGLILGYK